MVNCCHYDSDEAGRLFSRFARRHRRHYQHKGLSKSQQQLTRGISLVGVGGATLLEIGCGVGYLQQKLLADGAASATGVDLSETMIAQARRLAEAQGFAGRTAYHVGDFVSIREQVPMSDITLLDKVICCYPDAEGMVKHSLDKTRRLYALTYPKNNWFNRLGVRILGTVMRLLRIEFRNFVHDPLVIERWATERSFQRVYSAQTLLWDTRVYARVPEPVNAAAPPPSKS